MLDIFNATYYLARNPDVHAAVQSGALTAREHFDRWGKYEGRDPPLCSTPASILPCTPTWPRR